MWNRAPACERKFNGSMVVVLALAALGSIAVQLADAADYSVLELLSDRVQAGADADTAAEFNGASSDGTRVFFETTERLVAADTDSALDVYQRAGSTTTLISDRVQAGADADKNASFGGA